MKPEWVMVAVRHVEPDSICFITGTVGAADTCVTVRRAWIIFPTALFVRDVAFLIAIIARWHRGE